MLTEAAGETEKRILINSLEDKCHLDRKGNLYDFSLNIQTKYKFNTICSTFLN